MHCKTKIPIFRKNYLYKIKLKSSYYFIRELLKIIQ